MPRPTKAIRRQLINAGLAWKKGDRKEAAKLWANADKTRKEVQAKKKKGKPGREAAEAAKAKAAEEKAPEGEGQTPVASTE